MPKNYYDENADRFISDTASVDMREHYARFLPWIPKGGTIVDAGCGSGRDSLAFKKMGYQIEAFDASSAMVEATREFADVPVSKMTFQTYSFDHLFDGIWACASLLHVPRSELKRALIKLATSLVTDGIIYASFKYGDTEREEGGRYFNDMTELLIADCVRGVSSLTINETWTTGDVRVGRFDEKWLNCTMIKST